RERFNIFSGCWVLRKMKLSNFVVTSSLLAILITSGVSPFVVKSAGSPGADWTGPMGSYPFNSGFSAQTELSTSNVGQVQLSWAFPIPAAPPTISAGVGGFLSPQGSIVTPLIIGGVVYTITNFQLLIALDASSGKIVWTKNLATLNAPNIIAG